METEAGWEKTQHEPVRSNAGRGYYRADAGEGRKMVTVVAVTLVISDVTWLGV